MNLRPPRSTLTDTPLPTTTLCQSWNKRRQKDQGGEERQLPFGMTSRWPVMTEPHRQQIDRYRCCDGHIGKRAGNFGMMGDMVHQYRNTGADGSGRGEDKVMREVPHKGAAQTVQQDRKSTRLNSSH